MDRIASASASHVSTDFEADFSAALGIHEEGNEVTDVELTAFRFLDTDIPVAELPEALKSLLIWLVDADAFRED